MTDFAGRVPVCLRIPEAYWNFAGRQVATTVAMVLPAGVGNVDGLGLVVALDRLSLLCPYWKCNWGQ